MRTNPERFLDQETIEKIKEIAIKNTGVPGEPPVVTYAIGDLHGMHVPLMKMLEYITELRAHGEQSRFIFLGDYVDRGPDSAAVIAIIRLLQELMPHDMVIALMGNHEHMMIGEIKAYGNLHYDASTMKSFSKRGFLRKPPGDVMKWLVELPLIFEDDKHIYVHAGLRPNQETQRESDLLWIREEFLNYPYHYGKHVFHGHTPSLYKIDSLSWRTNLDGGAVFDGGTLLAAEIDPDLGKPISIYQIADKKGNWEWNETKRIWL